MCVEISKSLLIDIVNSLKLLCPNFELNSSLGKVRIEFSLEISGIYHELLVLFVLLP
jgi:hypothetical protein